MTNDTRSIEELRRIALQPTLDAAVFDGFTRETLKQGAEDAGEDRSIASVIWPHGVDDLLAFWSSEADSAAADAVEKAVEQNMRIREKVTEGVWGRISYLAPNKEAARRAAGVMAFPYRHPLVAKLTWKSADAIWRALGDTSTDFNFYSKRAILSGVISSTQARWLADEAEDSAPTREFLERRIEDVMKIEKLKARVKIPSPSGVIGSLAKMRYGSR
ncbi:MAG: COQ9 family protein [Pseudomonadota bacterium]